jgi:hypothetical protein
MKVGTAVARHAFQSANLQLAAILHYALWTAVFPISPGGPVTLGWLPCRSIPGIDETCQDETQYPFRPHARIAD